MYLELLGSPQLNISGELHSLVPKRLCLLLSYLAYRQEWVTRDELLVFFWPEKSEDAARRNLRQLLFNVKQEIYSESLIITNNQLRLDIPNDVSELQAALELKDWAKALELYKGDFLEGIHKNNTNSVEQWLTLTRHELKNSWRYAVLKQSSELNASQAFDASILNLKKALEKDKLSEEFLQALLHAQMQAGQFQEARQSYENFSFVLEQELGLEPSEQTQELFKSINLLEQKGLQVVSQSTLEVTTDGKTINTEQDLTGQNSNSSLDSNLDISEYISTALEEQDLQHQQNPAPAITYNPYSNPSALTPFIGRVQELISLSSFISAPEQILTIMGAGGIGKTRLAEQFLIEQAHNFRHGSIDVSLASIWLGDAGNSNPTAKDQSIEAIATAIAYALDLKLSGIESVKQQVLTAISNKEILILLDNFEQLQQVSAFVVELATAAPQSKIVVTSRATLGLSGEVVYDLQGLAVPDMPTISKATIGLDSISETNTSKSEAEVLVQLEHYDAIALFLASARRMSKPLLLNTDTQSFLINICQILEGIPLALELAASWLRLLSLQELHKELCKGLSLLGDADSDADSKVDYQNQRHHSLKTVFDYSWSLLSPKQQTVLAKLAVFQSPFSLKAARSVTGGSLIDLLMLVNSSLLQRNATEDLSIHKFTQEYLLLKLHNMPSVQEAAKENYKNYYVTLLAERRDNFHTQKEKATLELIEKAVSNVDMVWEQMLQAKDYVAIDQALYSLTLYYKKKGLFKEGDSRLSQAYTHLSELVSDTSELVPDTNVNDSTNWINTDWINSKTSSLARVLAKILINRGRFQRYLKNQAEAVSLSQKGLQLEELSRPYFKPKTEYLISEIALAHNTIGSVKMVQGDTDTAKTQYYKALEIYQELENNNGIGTMYNNLGILYQLIGDFKEAERYALKSVDVRKRAGELSSLASSLRMLGDIARVQNNFTAANDYYQQCLTVSTQVNDLFEQLYLLNDFGVNAYHQENYSDAEKYWLQALALQQANDTQPDVYLIFNLGLIGVKNQDTDKAVSFFLEAFDMDMTTYDRIQLLLFMGLTFLESWQNEDTAAVLFEQVLRSPEASADNQRVAQEKFDQLSDSARSKARANQRDLQEVYGQMIEELSAMQENKVGFSNRLSTV